MTVPSQVPILWIQTCLTSPYIHVDQLVAIYLLTVSPIGFLSPVKPDLMGNNYMYITGLLLGLNVIVEKVQRTDLLILL